MTCPHCGSDNPVGKNFCGDCGTALENRCPQCGASLRPTAKFCDECGVEIRVLGVRVLAARGKTEALSPNTLPANTLTPSPSAYTPKHLAEEEVDSRRSRVDSPRSYTPRHLAEKILNSRAALEGERKQVTVLFADVKGSMELAEQLDPEEWSQIMQRFFQILADGVERFEGFVDKFTGDGIMALFGAPIAHEDHAHRACYAALHLRDELRRHAEEVKRTHGLNFSVRMGLNSGEVVVGKIGDDLRMDYTAQGHTVGLAARMEQLAAPDNAYLSEHTARLVSGYFDLRDLGEFHIKGARAPLRVYELAAAGRLRTRFEAERVRGLSRFVGREREMAVLEAALAQATGGPGQVVGVVAPPGVGKSRLCFEFAERCRARGIPVYEARGVAHGRQIPLLPMLELFRAYFGITGQDAERTAREKIAGRLLLLDEALHAELPFVFDLLGVSDPEHLAPSIDPEALQRRLFAIARRIVQADGRREASLTLMEDLHWIDAASEAFLEQIVEANAGTRGLVLVNFRPEYRGRWMQKSYYQQVALVPLGAAAIRDLLCDLLGGDPGLGALNAAIERTTGGNPFFIEEIVRDLVETGSLVGTKGAYRLARPVNELAVPASVQAVLAARIDRLPPREKQILQIAAVIGKTFPEPVLERVVGADPRSTFTPSEMAAALAALSEAEFVHEEAVYPEREYAFKHPLTQQVAYESLLREHRRRTHAGVARVLEALDPSKLDERAALLAHHWEEAGEPLAAARWHARAAEWIGLNDYAEAHAHWQRVRALLGQAPESPEASELQVRSLLRLLMLGFRVGAFQGEAAAVFAEGKALLEGLGDLRSLALLMDLYAGIRENAGAVREYLELASEATRLADRTDDAAVRAGVRVDLVWALFLTGRLADAVAVGDEGLEIVSEDAQLGMDLFGWSPLLMLNLFPAYALTQMGRLHEAEKRIVVALRLARGHGPPESLCYSHAFHVFVAQVAGEARRAVGAAQAALEAGESSGSPQALAVAFAALATAHTLSGESEKAIDACDHCLSIMREKGVLRDTEAYALAMLASAHLLRGEVARAQALADEAAKLARSQGTLVFLCAANVLRARALIGRDGARAAGEVEAILAEAEQLIAETGATIYRPDVHLVRAELARLSGDETARQRELREAHRLLTAMGATARAEQVAKEPGGWVC
jgi:class 3 adenylate cyclase/tetratricopeptide (TPR) repeat protein